ncbi:MAG TPA: MarR family winged helix-turn-helix transcriptional regulator [Rhizomicrobium sp.]|nr:MarR family winged helix-turn-helix transcriptional regulator [Rhizomicrobium sp.]
MPTQKRTKPVEFYGQPMNSIGYLTRITFRAFSRHLERKTLPYGVSAGQWPFLRALWVEEGLTQRELSRRVAMREPTTVTALNVLQKGGLVRRVPSTKDNRKIHIYLTAKGRRLKDKLMPFVAEVNATAAHGVTAEEVETLRRILLKMSDNLAKEEAAYLKSSGGVMPFGAAAP